MAPGYDTFGYETKTVNTPVAFPPQHQGSQPGIESAMNPRPIYEDPQLKGAGRLAGRAALITGGDSGIGRAVAAAFAREGADVAFVYRSERTDAQEARAAVEKYGRRCLPLEGDLGDEAFCGRAVQSALSTFGRVDILVNNAAVQYPRDSILEIGAGQLEETFRVNLFSMFYLTKAALPHLAPGSSVINTASVTAYEGNERLIDYSASKGAIVSFTRSLSLSLVKIGVRVNAVAPGPVWTPLIPASFSAEEVKAFGVKTPMKRAAQPFEIAPAYVYLASAESGYMTGQVLHLNGGTMTES